MKVLIAGLGGVGQRHVRNLRALRGDALKISAFRARGLPNVISNSLSLEPDSDVARRYDIDVFTDFETALDDGPDAVVVASPTSLHLSCAIEAAARGCALFIEKPVAVDLDGIDRLVDIVQRKGLVTLVGYQLRFHPLVLAMRSIVLDGSLGSILAARAVVGEYLPWWHKYEDYRKSYAARRDLGGGVVLSQIHEINYLCWTFGYPGRVFAAGGHLSSLEIDCEDVVSSTLICSGARGVLPVQLHQDFVQRPGVRRCEIVGDDGSLSLDLRANKLVRYDSSGDVADCRSEDAFDRNALFRAEMEHFLGCVEGRDRSSIPLSVGVADLRVAVAIQESLSTGRVVEMTHAEVLDA